MSFQYFDTLTAAEKSLKPRASRDVGIYLCGPTVYNYIHIGNARPAVVFDVLVRHLRASRVPVTYVRNFTDVDDKIIHAAVENQVDPRVHAERFIGAYRQDVGALGCIAPDAEPRVSDHIPEIVAMVETLVAKRHAYVRDGDVYFAVRTFPAYGKLSKRDLKELSAGARVEVDERKDDPLDFALWKAAKPHEPPGARWPSPWGEGRPGWHIECSAMSRKQLGDGFDLHAGGLDLIFPHHENEIAQSECATGVPFVQGWMHNGFINVNDAKLSKSTMETLGWKKHYFVLRNVLEHVEPEAVRLWLLGTHYRSPLNFELSGEELPDGAAKVRFPGLEEAERRVEYFYETLARLAARQREGTAAPGDEMLRNLRGKFDEALDRDLNTAGALAPLGEAYKRANELCDSNRKDPEGARALSEALKSMGEVLGLGLRDPTEVLSSIHRRRSRARGLDPVEIDGLLDARNAARKSKDFARADGIRTQLLARGVEIRDNPGGGSSWRVV